jgi:ADP-heptose:LPS heptosyltransferase
VIRLGALGDVVRTLPAVSGLRSLYPGAHLAWLVEPDSAGVVEAAGVVDEIVVFPRRDLMESWRAGDGLSLARQGLGFLRRLRARRFDLTLDFHGILKSGLLSRLSGAPLRYGHARGVVREGAFLFANRHAHLQSPRVSRYERNAALVRALRPDVQIPERVALSPSRLAVARLGARLRVSGREHAERFVLIHPGSSRGAVHKRYPAGAWAETARLLAREGLAVWIAAGSNRHERRLVEEILRASQGAARPAPETRSFDDLLALLDRASVFASGDTGPLHAASMVGVPVVQLLGPTDPVHNQPWPASRHRRVFVPLPCSPCRRGCDEPACMRVLPPSRVCEAILEMHLLSTRPRASSADAGR